MTEPEQLTMQSAELLNDIIPALMFDLEHRGFGTTVGIDATSAEEIPEGSAIDMVATLLAELPPAQVNNLAFNAVVQLAMVHIKLNEKGGAL